MIKYNIWKNNNKYPLVKTMI